MTQEEKELLLKDLSARLPYSVKVQTTYINPQTKERKDIGTDVLSTVEISLLIDGYYEPKPYLFPLSSMTEEQCEELRNLIYEHFTLDDEFNEGIRFKTYGDILVWLDGKPINECYFIFDWFNKKHFDYRGLIPKGLAIDATGLNIY